jgi:hypothetical protein
MRPACDPFCHTRWAVATALRRRVGDSTLSASAQRGGYNNMHPRVGGCRSKPLLGSS